MAPTSWAILRMEISPFVAVVPRVIANAVNLAFRGDKYRTLTHSIRGYANLLKRAGFESVTFVRDAAALSVAHLGFLKRGFLSGPRRDYCAIVFLQLDGNALFSTGLPRSWPLHAYCTGYRRLFLSTPGGTRGDGISSL